MATYKPTFEGFDGMTPQQVASRRKVAEALTREGMSTEPVGHWTQALARVAQSGVGGFQTGSANKMEAEGRRAANMTFTKALTNKAPMRDVAGALMGNPWSEDEGRSLAVAQMKQDAERQGPEYALDLEMAQLKRDKLKKELADNGATTDDIREYQFARQNGFQGGFMDFFAAKKGAMGGDKPPMGYEWGPVDPATGQRTQRAIIGGPASKLPSDVAGKVGMMRVAVDNMPKIRDIFLGKEGPVDPKTGKPTRQGANVGMLDYYATRGEIGEGVRLTTGAIESVLRAASGAAVPEQEVTRYQSLFMPSPYDTPETKARKVDALEKWIGTMLSTIQEGRPVALDEAHRLAQARGGTQPAAAASGQSQAMPPPEAVRELLADPSPEAQREFEEVFGVPADQFLQGQY